MLAKFSTEIIKSVVHVADLSIDGEYKLRMDRRNVECVTGNSWLEGTVSDGFL